MRGSLEGMFNVRPYATEIMVGNNDTMSSVSIGQYKGMVFKSDGTTMDLTLNDVLYVPNLMVNLFSITKALESPPVKFSSIDDLSAKAQKYVSRLRTLLLSVLTVPSPKPNRRS
jgi:hypothetical protein